MHGKKSAGTRSFLRSEVSQLGFAAIALALVSCGGTIKEPLEETLQQIYPLNSTAAVTITNQDGSIRIYGGGDELRVQATKKAYTAERLRQIRINIATVGDSASIASDLPPKPKWGLSDRSGTVDYVVVVPETARLVRAELVNGELAVEGLRGQAVEARLGTGLLFARNCFSNLDLSLARGNINLFFDWWENANFSVAGTVTRGNIWSFFPSNAAFRLQAEAPNGRIANDFLEKEKRRAEAANKIDMAIGEAGGVRVKIRATNGNIRVAETNP
ncbi:MAG: hypothetical protein ABR514_04670 [Chthoniobacterales bacterium]